MHALIRRPTGAVLTGMPLLLARDDRRAGRALALSTGGGAGFSGQGFVRGYSGENVFDWLVPDEKGDDREDGREQQEGGEGKGKVHRSLRPSALRLDKTVRTVHEGVRVGTGRDEPGSCGCGTVPEPGFVERIGAFVERLRALQPFSDRTSGFVDPSRHLCTVSADV